MDHFEDVKPEYLQGLVLKNNFGKTPIDIAVDNKSPRNTELMLRKLSLFED